MAPTYIVTSISELSLWKISPASFRMISMLKLLSALPRVFVGILFFKWMLHLEIIRKLSSYAFLNYIKLKATRILLELGYEGSNVQTDRACNLTCKQSVITLIPLA